MQLKQFNQIAPNLLYTILIHCVHIPRWASDLESARPFCNRTALLDYAWQHAQTWTWSELSAALETQPRFAQDLRTIRLTQKEQQFLAHERALLCTTHPEQQQLFLACHSYETKFHFRFFLDATGLNTAQVLEAVYERLHHDLKTEQNIIHQHFIQLMLSRLATEIEA